MTLEGTIAMDLGALALALWILDLIRRGRLYVGYGVLLLAMIAAGAVLATVPGLLGAAVRTLSLLFPGSPIAVVVHALTVFLLVYVLSQLSIISNRLATLAQEIAILRARKQDE